MNTLTVKAFCKTSTLLIEEITHGLASLWNSRFSALNVHFG